VAREGGGFGWCIRAPIESEGEHALGHEACDMKHYEGWVPLQAHAGPVPRPRAREKVAPGLCEID
jgi:hypothetical protein